LKSILFEALCGYLDGSKGELEVKITARLASELHRQEKLNSKLNTLKGN
jgi:hypothetical protein